MRKTDQAAPAAVIEDEAPPADAESRPSFYDSTEIPLKLLLLVFAIAIDVGAGVAIHRARQEGAVNDEEYRRAAQELTTLRSRLAEVVFEITALTNAPGIASAQFWRDFYRAMLTQTVRKALSKVLPLGVLAFALWQGRALAADRLNVVAVLDLSSSEDTKGPDGKTPFEKNVAGIRRLLGSVPAGTHLSVIGITDDSIRDPAPLLTARVSSDVGAFGERLQAARTQLVRAWQTRSARLRPAAPGTDIFGTLFLASEIFRREPHGGRNVLVIFSDMRNATESLNLEMLLSHAPDAVVNDLEGQAKIADLAGVTVYVAGANGGGRDLKDWQAVKEFWMAYFGKAGARCASYAILEEAPILGR